MSKAIPASRYPDRLPTHRLRDLAAIANFRAVYLTQNGSSPSVEEIAAALHRSPAKISEIIRDGERLVSS